VATLRSRRTRLRISPAYASSSLQRGEDDGRCGLDIPELHVPATIKPPGESATKHNDELVKKHYNDIFQVVWHLLAPAGARTIGFLGDGVPKG
jgi:hypothetical protein